VALYIFFFPQLIAGPILRWSAIGPQLAKRAGSLGQFAEGIRRFTGGLAKKVLIANTVALPADQIFALPASELSLPTAWFGLLCYTLQIYFDFSGYSDMAIGMGKMFGFTFMENFDFPYVSQCIREFWRRWHISLSTWFRDYLYIPLGGSRVTLPRWCFNVMVVFLISGMWHGASWSFAAWGALHGFYLIAARLISRLRRKPDLGATSAGNAFSAVLVKAIRVVVTFNLVAFAWIFFRAPTLADAGTIIRRIAGRHFWESAAFTVGDLNSPAFTIVTLIIAAALIVFLLLAEWLLAHGDIRALNNKPIWVRWAAYYSMGLLILWIGALGARSFIYFQF
jgi:alginate O-acetyltransferase complex protein AlgI